VCHAQDMARRSLSGYNSSSPYYSGWKLRGVKYKRQRPIHIHFSFFSRYFPIVGYGKWRPISPRHLKMGAWCISSIWVGSLFRRLVWLQEGSGKLGVDGRFFLLFCRVRNSGGNVKADVCCNPWLRS
jgi:hypothetical protein